MSSTKRRACSQDDGARAKRRLVDSMRDLSLSYKHDNRPTQPTHDYMDTSGPNTVFIPSIDEFLDDEDEVKGGDLFCKTFEIPQAVLRRTENIPVHERPTLALIRYVPKDVVIWKHYLNWLRHVSRHDDSMYLDKTPEATPQLEDVDMMDID